MVTILEQKQYIWKQKKTLFVKMLSFYERIFIDIKATWITWRIE